MTLSDGSDLEFVDLLDGLERLNDPAVWEKHAAEQRFLKEAIFCGLRLQHPRFDSAGIAHFGAETFKAVVERCAHHGVSIVGVEVFTRRGRLLEVCFQEKQPWKWCLDLLGRYQDYPRVTFCASYSVPDHVLELHMPNSVSGRASLTSEKPIGRRVSGKVTDSKG